MKETSLFDSLLEEPQKPSGPVTCLGMTFENDEARRAHFTEELRKKLQDPEFRKIEGFPIGSDEAILNLSDPPYYTACPNPWIADFIAEWEAQKPEQPGVAPDIDGRLAPKVRALIEEQRKNGVLQGDCPMIILVELKDGQRLVRWIDPVQAASVGAEPYGTVVSFDHGTDEGVDVHALGDVFFRIMGVGPGFGIVAADSESPAGDPYPSQGVLHQPIDKISSISAGWG